jgi:hypothetical protein
MPDGEVAYHSERVYMYQDGDVCGPVNMDVNLGDVILVRNVEVGELWECYVRGMDDLRMAQIERR